MVLIAEGIAMDDIKLMLKYTKTMTVLYVEDDEILRDTTARLFNNYFLHLDTSIDGQDGLNKYIAYEKENLKPYDLVITDIKMPKLDGLELSKKILNSNPMQSIIIVSAHNENEFLERALELGLTAFIPKPIDANKLNQAIYKASQAIYDHKFVEDHAELVKKNKNVD